MNMTEPVSLPHGGDWMGFQAQYGSLPLDFSANVSPLGVPQGVRNALAEAVKTADRYPDPLCRELSAELSTAERIPVKNILCGNGAADLIFRSVLACRPRRALLCAPTFAEYRNALSLCDCEVQTFYLDEEDGFRLCPTQEGDSDRKMPSGEGFLNRIVSGVEMVFLCEPNNPTGRTTPKELLVRILRRCAEVGARLVVDECFNDFLDEPEAHTLKPYIEEYPNLLILKAFTKLYAMAGVRLGYCLCGDAAFLEKMRHSGAPWAVSNLAQAAGIAALHETAYREEVRTLIRTERTFLKTGLLSLGFFVIEGEANYLLFRSEWELTNPLRRKGILLRSCANYDGLGEHWIRTAVRTHAENEILLAALRQIVEEMR